MKLQGQLINWNDNKGYGFVEPYGGGTRCFVHIKSFQRSSRRPQGGDWIDYEQVCGATGKCKAVNVSLAIDRHLRPRTRRSPFNLGLLISAIFCATLVGLTLSNRIPIEVLYFYAAASILVFIVYAYDKSAAQKNRWRTPENHLHLLSLLGGWPGALYAQNRLRHKSSKKAFKQVFWLTVVVNISLFGWLASNHGQGWLKTIFG